VPSGKVAGSLNAGTLIKEFFPLLAGTTEPCPKIHLVKIICLSQLLICIE
jgi:hypothetical protein